MKVVSHSSSIPRLLRTRSDGWSLYGRIAGSTCLATTLLNIDSTNNIKFKSVVLTEANSAWTFVDSYRL